MKKIVLNDTEPTINPDSSELADIIVNRLGLMPRKKGSTEKMKTLLIELYERSKAANKEKRLDKAVITVEEMAIITGITRQTMYDYLKRWLAINLLVKTSFIMENKAVIGYKLNGATLEAAFDKVRSKINENLDFTSNYITELQRILKNEKISHSQRSKD